MLDMATHKELAAVASRARLVSYQS